MSDHEHTGKLELSILHLVYFIIFCVLFWERPYGHIYVYEFVILALWVYGIGILVFIVIGIIAYLIQR